MTNNIWTSSSAKAVRRVFKARKLAGIARYRAAMRVGVGAAIEHQAVLASMKLNTIIDVGANKGQFSLVARQLHPDARIVAFEPLSDAAATFQKVFAGDPKVALHRCALGQADGESVINVSHSADSSSLLPISDLQSELFPGTHKNNEERINVRRGESEVPRDIVSPVLLKMDVQGYELEVLKGLESRLQTVDHIYAELSFVELYVGQQLAGDVIAWLSERSFGVVGVYNLSTGPSGMAIQADVLFSRRKTPAM